MLCPRPRYRTLAEETGPETARGNVLTAALSAGGGGGGLGFGGDLPPGSSDAALYILLRAADRFYAQTGRYPGAAPGPADPQEDVPLLRQAAMQVRVCTDGLFRRQHQHRPEPLHAISQAHIVRLEV